MLTPCRLEELVDPKKPAFAMASRDFPACTEGTSIKSLLKMMIEARSKHAAIVGSDGKFKGMVTDMDVLGYLGGDATYDGNAMPRGKCGRTARKAGSIALSPVRKITDNDVNTITTKTSIKEALEAFKKSGQGALPIVDNSGKIRGMLSKRNLIEAFYLKAPGGPVSKGKSKVMIKDVMVKPMIVKKNFPIGETARMMCMGKFRRFPVTENRIMTGIITVHDILYFLNESGDLEVLGKESGSIAKIANKNVVYAEPEMPISEAIKKMLAKKIGALPVVEDDELKGIVTFTDIVDTIR